MRVAAYVFGGVASVAPAVIRDLSAIAGAGLVAYGAWLAYPPAGYIIAGAIMLTAAILGARRAD